MKVQLQLLLQMPVAAEAMPPKALPIPMDLEALADLEGLVDLLANHCHHLRRSFLQRRYSSCFQQKEELE